MKWLNLGMILVNICSSTWAGPLRAGAATSNVSPPLNMSINGNMQDGRALRIHDELLVRALVLDDGESKLAIAVVDSCMLPRPVLDEAKRQASRLTGILPANMLVSATHTHSAPTSADVFQSRSDADYLRFLERRIADAIAQAYRRLEPAEIGWGKGSVPQHVFNRRWRQEDGGTTQNPLGRTEKIHTVLVGPAGPTDPELAILSVRSASGRPLALLANYSLHYIGGVGRGNVSADYFGYFARYLEDRLGPSAGPPFVAMMTNGTSGDINNVDRSRPRSSREPYEQIRRVGREVGDEALRVYRTLQHGREVSLRAAQAEITLGVRLPSSSDLMAAKNLVGRAEGPAMQSREEIYARETLLLSDYPQEVSVNLQVLRIGELAVAAIPCEVFVELGLELKKTSPFPATFTISLANGYFGYLPTPYHHELGGYETWRARSSFLEVGASEKVMPVLQRLLAELER